MLSSNCIKQKCERAAPPGPFDWFFDCFFAADKSGDKAKPFYHSTFDCLHGDVPEEEKIKKEGRRASLNFFDLLIAARARRQRR